MGLSRREPAAPPREDVRPDAPDLAAIYEHYLDPIYRFLYTRVGNREDAEDLASQVFLKAFRQLDMDRSERSIASWLFTVARTVLADHWRDEYRYGPLVELNANLAGRSDSWTAPDDGEKMESVGRVLSCLPARARAVLELRFLHGYSVEETAQALGITPGNVKVIQHRALAKAADQMDYEAIAGAGETRRTQAIA